MEEKIDVLNELGEFTGEVATRMNVMKKDYGIELYMHLL